MTLFIEFPDRAGGYALQNVDWNTYLRDNINETTWNLVSHIEPTGQSAGWSSVNTLPFTQLRIVTFARNSAAAGVNILKLRLNGDAGANYDHQMMGHEATTGLFAQVTADSAFTVGAVPAANVAAGIFAGSVTDILGYKDASRNTIIQTMSATKQGIITNGCAIRHWGGQWRNVAAINDIEIRMLTSNFVAGSTISLYGMA